ncbi:MAG: ComF family protein [Pseudomonadota bacterium]
MSKFANIARKYSQRALKQNCLLCAASNANDIGLCTACFNDLPWHPASSCPQCGLSSSYQVCGSCLSSPPDFDASYALCLYSYPVDAMMQAYKYGSQLNLSRVFGQLLSQKTQAQQIDMIIPMPMHPTRLKERGFNQALEIAKVLSQHNTQLLDYKSVIRQTLTPPQASLPFKQRVKNIRGAFSVIDAGKLVGKRIAIVDDVMTTGTSLNELAKTLKRAGAAHVECWVIARTLPH